MPMDSDFIFCQCEECSWLDIMQSHDEEQANQEQKHLKDNSAIMSPYGLDEGKPINEQ